MNLHIFSSLVIVTITTSLICLDYASTRAVLMPRDDATSSSAYLLPYSTQLSREESDNNLTSIPIISSPTTISARLLSNISGLSDQQPVPLFSINKYFNSVKLKSILLIISPNSSIVVGEDIKSNNPNISTEVTASSVIQVSHSPPIRDRFQDAEITVLALNSSELYMNNFIGQNESIRNVSGVLMWDLLGEGNVLFTVAPLDLSDEETRAVDLPKLAVFIIGVPQITSPERMTGTIWILTAMVIMIFMLLGGLCWMVVAHWEQWGDGGGEEGTERMMVDMITPFRAPGEWNQSSQDNYSAKAVLRRAPSGDISHETFAIADQRTAAAQENKLADADVASLKDFQICYATKLSNLSLPHTPQNESDPQVVYVPRYSPHALNAIPVNTPTSSTSSFDPLSSPATTTTTATSPTITTIHTPSSL
ncbi:hypothetical protein PCANC_11420 [Puccinia coronata f. sp. avenae]|uniref:Uncharacterized protein n=1 Tax=Puccinia coronata f. sp. avenae TaxID=200324 RepID=A0A2N5VMF0_9BASI|nr:hypothetical protein PCANC_11420 [Puccinia coronata f. sp. avenae]